MTPGRKVHICEQKNQQVSERQRMLMRRSVSCWRREEDDDWPLEVGEDRRSSLEWSSEAIDGRF